MTITKRHLLDALDSAPDDAVIFIDDGIDSIECRSVTVADPENRPDIEELSTQPDGSFVPDYSVVLRLAN